MKRFALAALLFITAPLLTGCLAAAVVGTAGVVVGTAGAVVGTTAKVAVKATGAVVGAVIPDDDKDKKTSDDDR